MSSEKSFDEMVVKLKYIFKQFLDIDIESEPRSEIISKLANSQKIITIIGMKSDCKNMSTTIGPINTFLMKLIDISIPYNKRNIVFFEQSSKEQGDNIFYPLMYLAFNDKNKRRCFEQPLTKLTDENRSRFETYGNLD